MNTFNIEGLTADEMNNSSSSYRISSSYKDIPYYVGDFRLNLPSEPNELNWYSVIFSPPTSSLLLQCSNVGQGSPLNVCNLKRMQHFSSLAESDIVYSGWRCLENRFNSLLILMINEYRKYKK